MPAAGAGGPVADDAHDAAGEAGVVAGDAHRGDEDGVQHTDSLAPRRARRRGALGPGKTLGDVLDDLGLDELEGMRTDVQRRLETLLLERRLVERELEKRKRCGSASR